MNRQTRELKIMHINIQSINNKLAELKHYLATNQIDICSVNETWLNSNKKLHVPNYEVVRRDRSNQQGGGVLLLIHKEIQFQQLQHQHDEEIIIIKLKQATKSKQDITLVSYYNPPQRPINQQAIQDVLNSQSNVLIIGDLNAHHPYWLSKNTNKSGEEIFKLVLDNQLSILNDDNPTYEPLHRPDYKAILDLAICDEELSSQITSCQVSDEFRSDHLAVNITLKSSLPKRKQLSTITIKSTNWTQFKTTLANQPLQLQQLNNPTEIDEAAAQLTNQIQQALHSTTTSKDIIINTDKPLIQPYYVVQLIKQKRKARRKFQKTRNAADKTELNRLTAKVRKEIISHQVNKWQNHCSSLNQLKTNDTKLWRAIESIDSTNPKSFKQPNLTGPDGQLTNNPATTTNIFADHLEGVFKDSNDPSFDVGNFNHVSREAPSFFTNNEQPIEYTTPTEIYQLIQKEIGTHGAPGQDGITNKALKNLPSCCLESISSIFNASLKLAYIPTAWKLAIVVMIPSQ